jgi:hypothetical protein
MHACDVNNVYKPFVIGEKWTIRLQEEFNEQGDKEKKLGMPISPYMDRTKPNTAQMSCNFIDFIVAPLLAPLTIAFPGLLACAEALLENRTSWHKKLVTQIQAEDTIEETTTTEQQKKNRLEQLEVRASKFVEVFAGTQASFATTPSDSPVKCTDIDLVEDSSDHDASDSESSQTVTIAPALLAQARQRKPAKVRFSLVKQVSRGGNPPPSATTRHHHHHHHHHKKSGKKPKVNYNRRTSRMITMAMLHTSSSQSPGSPFSRRIPGRGRGATVDGRSRNGSKGLKPLPSTLMGITESP